MKPRTLVMQRRYFGLEPRAFRTGAARALARMSDGDGRNARFDAQSVADDFCIDVKAGTALLHALVAAGLVRPDDRGIYRPTTRMHEYAQARIVVPLSRERARTLARRAAELAARINAEWTRNPLRIGTLLVSGSYMSRREKLSELTLWLVVQPRSSMPARPWGRTSSKAEAARQIAAKLRALSPYIVLRLSVDTSVVERPFTAIFHADDDGPPPAPAWARFREWGASISRRLTPRSN